jgi:hypothetical protein
MQARRFFMTGLALGCALLAPRLQATTVEPPSFDSLVSHSDYVVRAVVTSATPEWRESDGKRYISTHFELEVSEVIKGTPPSPLTLDLLGGKIGEVEFKVSGMPILEVGDESILFVYGPEKKLYPLVAMMHGVYPILREAKSGKAYVLRANGMPLYATADVSLSMDRPSAVLKQSGTSVQPLTPAAFAQEIRQRASRVQTNRNVREN